MRRFLDYYRQFEELSPEESSARLLAQRDERRSRELATVPVLDLSGSEWHEPPDAEIVDAATFALRRALNRYPDGAAPAAVAAVAARHGVSPEQVALGHGAGELMQAALRRLAAAGEVVMPWPGWATLPALAARAGARPVPVALAADGGADVDALADAVTSETRAIVLASPSDPTGLTVAPGALRELADRAGAGVALLVDEALVELAGEELSLAPLLAELPDLLVFRSFSKAWGLAGLRAGYVLGGASAAPLLGELGPGLGVAAPVQAAIAAALDRNGRGLTRVEARRAAAAAERDRLRALLAGTPFRFAPSRTHLVWLHAEDPRLDAATLVHELERRRIQVASGILWGDSRHVRAALAGPAATERLAAALAELA